MRLLFDQGTLVLAEPPDLRLDFVPGLVWDERVGLFRAPAYRYHDIVSALSKRGLSFVNEARSSLSEVTGPWLPNPLRSYQQAALLAWGLGNRQGILVMPTGSGKTRVAAAALSLARVRALCLVPTRALLQQWLVELRKFYGGAIGCLGDGQLSIGPVTVATFESAYRHMPRIGARFGLLIIDEVHHFGTGMRDEALEMCLAEQRLGLTATPPSAAALTKLDALVGPIAFQLNVADLAGKWLAPFDSVVLRMGLDEQERAAYDKDYGQFRALSDRFRQDYPNGTWQELVASANHSDEGRAALAAWRRSRQLIGFTRAKAAALRSLLMRHRGARVLVFTADNATAYAIAREHLIMPITCDVSRAEREQALTAFREGALSTLVSARVLNEGIDVPDAEVAIIVGGTQGAREHVQRIGRLLRPRPGKRALVYEMVTLGTAEARQAANRRQGLVAARALSA